MITLRRNNDRLHVQQDSHHIWYTFRSPEQSGASAWDFGVLTTFNEIWLSPGRIAAPLLGDEAEIVSYLYQGQLAQEDSTGSAAVVSAGEFQRMIPGRGIRHKETNASASDWAKVFRICLRPPSGTHHRAHEQRRFAAAQRHNLRCVVASPDGRQDSLRLQQNALIFSSVLDPGRHLIHELEPGHSAWLHVIRGEALLHDLILSEGDGMGVTEEQAISLTAQEQTEILVVELGQENRGSVTSS